MSGNCGDPMKNAEDLASEDSEDYGIERNADGNVVIKLGNVPPFEIPPYAAIKLAALLLKKAGAAVKISPGSLVARYKLKRAKPIEQALQDYEKTRGRMN